MKISAVFEVLEPMEEIAGQPGDRIVLRPWAEERRGTLQREIDPSWAFDPRCRLVLTDPPRLSPHHVLRYLRARLPCWPRRERRGLKLLE